MPSRGDLNRVWGPEVVRQALQPDHGRCSRDGGNRHYCRCLRGHGRGRRCCLPSAWWPPPRASASTLVAAATAGVRILTVDGGHSPQLYPRHLRMCADGRSTGPLTPTVTLSHRPMRCVCPSVGAPCRRGGPLTSRVSRTCPGSGAGIRMSCSLDSPRGRVRPSADPVAGVRAPCVQAQRYPGAAASGPAARAGGRPRHPGRRPTRRAPGRAAAPSSAGR
jgi:hypothetical protein